jgi:hypothetical protein
VRPRLELQPDFDKITMGQAAESYYGGWVEASIGGVLPVVYLDFLSMFVSAHALLRLWWKHYTAAHLTVEEIPPEEIAALLDRIRNDPDLLFSPQTQDELDFFAYVRPKRSDFAQPRDDSNEGNVTARPLELQRSATV